MVSTLCHIRLSDLTVRAVDKINGVHSLEIWVIRYSRSSTNNTIRWIAYDLLALHGNYHHYKSICLINSTNSTKYKRLRYRAGELSTLNAALSCEIKQDIGGKSQFLHIQPAFDAAVKADTVGILP